MSVLLIILISSCQNKKDDQEKDSEWTPPTILSDEELNEIFNSEKSESMEGLEPAFGKPLTMEQIFFAYSQIKDVSRDEEIESNAKDLDGDLIFNTDECSSGPKQIDTLETKYEGISNPLILDSDDDLLYDLCEYAYYDPTLSETGESELCDDSGCAIEVTHPLVRNIMLDVELADEGDFDGDESLNDAECGLGVYPADYTNPVDASDFGNDEELDPDLNLQGDLDDYSEVQ